MPRNDTSHESFFVNSFPRSGNTWMRGMLKKALDPMIYDYDPLYINLVGFQLRKFRMIPFRKLISRGGAMIKSHGKWDECSPLIKKVYLVRDGRDAYFSYYNFNVEHRGYRESWDSYFERHIIVGDWRDRRERFLGHWMGDWSQNVLSYLDREDVLILKYEDALNDAGEALSKVFDFLKIDCVDSGRMSEILLNSKKELEAKRSSHSRPRASSVWQDVFSPTQKDRFWEKHGECLSRLGYRQ